MVDANCSRTGLEPRERMAYSSFGWLGLPSFLSKRTPHSPFAALPLALPKSRLRWYLQMHFDAQVKIQYSVPGTINIV